MNFSNHLQWVSIPLKFLFTDQTTGSWGVEPDTDTGIICIRAADFITNELRHSKNNLTRREYELNEIKERQLQTGDLIIEKSGGGENQPVGRVVSFELNEIALCSNFLERLRPNHSILYSRFGAYLLYYLWSNRVVVKFIKQTTGIQNLDSKDYFSQVVDIPPLSEQKAIAHYLDQETATIDELIKVKKRLLELLNEKRRALITHAVTRGLNSDVPMRDSGVEWIGEIPKHWGVLRLRRVLKKMDYGISESVGIEGKIGVLRMGDIAKGEINYDKIGFVDNVDNDLILSKDDLLFNRTNSLDQIGKVAIFRDNFSSPVSFASYLVRMRCNDSVIPEYLNYLLNSLPILTWARSEALPAIGQANLNPNRYSYVSIPRPPVEEQSKIIEYIKAKTFDINNLFVLSEKTIDLLQERRTSLITAAVTGQLKIME